MWRYRDQKKSTLGPDNKVTAAQGHYMLSKKEGMKTRSANAQTSFVWFISIDHREMELNLFLV